MLDDIASEITALYCSSVPHRHYPDYRCFEYRDNVYQEEKETADLHANQLRAQSTYRIRQTRGQVRRTTPAMGFHSRE